MKDHAELEMRRKNAVIDSMAFADLSKAFELKDSALYYSIKDREELMGIAQGWHESYSVVEKQRNNAKKEVKRQKRLKVIAFAIAGIALILGYR